MTQTQGKHQKPKVFHEDENYLQNNRLFLFKLPNIRICTDLKKGGGGQLCSD